MVKQARRQVRGPKAPERGAKLLDTNSTKDRFLWLVEGSKYIVAGANGDVLVISDAYTLPQLFANKDGAV